MDSANRRFSYISTSWGVQKINCNEPKNAGYYCMKMDKMEERFNGLLVIEPMVIDDPRGFFMETYSRQRYREIGIEAEFVQDNHSLSLRKGTLRGMHYQLNPKAQSKLIRVVRGSVLDVAVDIRRGSPTFGKYLTLVLSAENKRQLYMPGGFAHGICSLADETEVIYKVDKYYAPEMDRSFRWDDPEIGIEWPVVDPILSERDRQAPSFADAEMNFEYEAN